MPTIPLNQLAFPLEWLALGMVKNDGACRHLRTQRRHSCPARLCPEAEFSGSEYCIPNRCQVESYSTVTSLPQQRRRIRRMPSSIGIGFCEIIEKHVCRAPPSTIVLQLRNTLRPVPDTDSASLHHL